MQRKIKTTIEDIVNLPLGILGVQMMIGRKIKGGGRSHSMPDWSERLLHAKNLGFSPKIIFDGGAFKGNWTQEASSIFPGAQIVLIEPNPFVHDAIKTNIANIHPAPVLIEAALSEMCGESQFNIWGNSKVATSASLLDHVQGAPNESVKVKLETLDHISEKLSLNPDLIKLDLQGGELSALKGGERVLRTAEFVMLEFGCLDAYIGRATPRDVMNLLYDYDFCLYDIVDCHYRPYDGAMTGGDFFFVKNTSNLKKYKDWK